MHFTARPHEIRPETPFLYDNSTKIARRQDDLLTSDTSALKVVLWLPQSVSMIYLSVSNNKFAFVFNKLHTLS